MVEIRQAAVIGAGVMGAGIAAQIANAGTPVHLLDIVPDGADDREVIAKGAIANLLKANPAPLMHKRNASLITPGNTEDHLDRLKDCDWIIEAVIENPAIKRDLYGRIAAVRKEQAVLSSNTSTIPLDVLTEGMDDTMRRHFLVTHFFNPPRYMRLLELVTGPDTLGDVTSAIRDFADKSLGKSVVDCKDTPGFIANRIGTFWLQCAVVEAIDGKVDVETADAAIGRPVGIPNTGVFGLLDLVGLDLMPHVLASMEGALPAGDAFHDVHREPELIKRLIADGYTGRKGKGGFYRLNPSDGNKTKQALDLQTGDYYDARRPKPDSVKAARKGGPRALMEHSDPAGRYAWAVMSKTLAYAAWLIPEIADEPAAVDEAMRLGYNWKFGPFELIDKLGPAWFAAKLRAEGQPVPAFLDRVGEGTFYRVQDGVLHQFSETQGYIPVTRAKGVLMLADVKRRAKPVASNRSASLWDIGDGVACLEFHSKMNSLNPFTLSMINKSIDIVQRDYKALVIYNEGSQFSVGANVGLLLIPAFLHAWFLVGPLVAMGQKAYKRLKFAPFPVVSAPSGLALGGGCEVLLHSDAVQANAETYTGLVEGGVGLVPGWGGCKEMLMRWTANPRRKQGPMPAVIKVFETIAMAVVATSAAEARDHLFLRDGDGISMNRDRLLADAKARALELADGYAPPEPRDIQLPGPTARVAMELAVAGFRKQGKATPHDVTVAHALADVLSGGDTDMTETVSEDDLLALERKAFVKLIRTPLTLARVKHMLKTGKPLRN
ncbi:MAG: 3-hydroxyacyl-CoA dehydrogenase/enoyl-CoA hydratase family protein [Rhodospirillaceae bacterium]|jgi:3-hydroxyacyl-CoA dehydrogenase|nr:3-hydroxyacyl-CoA dehydrogenase/enoyl-CoA hydratase family protein [Rhodospirillaceae bacterium]